jgi:hypothetical protein
MSMKCAAIGHIYCKKVIAVAKTARSGNFTMGGVLIVPFVANLLHKLSSPEIAKTTLMDLHNLCIVFAPAILRSRVFDLLSIENSLWEQKFTLKLMQLVRDAFPDDSIGSASAVRGPLGGVNELREGDTIVPHSRWKATGI